LWQGPKGDRGDRYVQISDNNSLVTFTEGPQGLPGPPGPTGLPGPSGRKVSSSSALFHHFNDDEAAT